VKNPPLDGEFPDEEYIPRSLAGAETDGGPPKEGRLFKDAMSKTKNERSIELGIPDHRHYFATMLIPLSLLKCIDVPSVSPPCDNYAAPLPHLQIS